MLTTLATRFAMLPLGLLQGALLARGLGPEGLGRYSATLVDVNIVTTVLALWEFLADWQFSSVNRKVRPPPPDSCGGSESDIPCSRCSWPVWWG